MKIAIAYFERLIHLVSRWSDKIAQGAVAAMMLLVAGNVLLRLCGKPIVGTYDWTSLIETILIALALGYCKFKGILPFLIALVVCAAILMAFPQIILFWPSLMTC